MHRIDFISPCNNCCGNVKLILNRLLVVLKYLEAIPASDKHPLHNGELSNLLTL